MYQVSYLAVIFFQLHFGVNSGATRFAIEQQAVNEATFRCPDEMGWKPQVSAMSLYFLLSRVNQVILSYLFRSNPTLVFAESSHSSC